MKGKRKHPKLKTEERPRHELRTFKVRCSQELTFYAIVHAHDAKEAEVVAENWCCESDAGRDDCLFWDSEATHRHSKFEAEEI